MLMQVNSLYCPADNFKMQQVDEEKFSHLSQMRDVITKDTLEEQLLEVKHLPEVLASQVQTLKGSQNHL